MPSPCQPAGDRPALPPFELLTDELVRELDVAGPRYTSYPTVPEWAPGFGHADHAAALERAGAAGAAEPLSLYLHLPFCQEMCLYCGCNVVISRSRAEADRYLDDLEREVALAAERLGARRRFARLHLGGGTPTSLDETQLERVHRIVTDRFTPVPGAELAVEIDPVVTTRAQIELLARLGFRRISMGVQDFDPRVQETVHRRQSYALTAERVGDARSAGFTSVNLDLIYGLPHQDRTTWKRTLDQIVSLEPDRIALFSFAFVPGLKPHQNKLPRQALPSGPAKLGLFRLAHEAFHAAGYVAIGMDHFARPADELAEAERRGELWRDFQGYTARKGTDTVAFGITGISDVGGAFAQTLRSRTRYHEELLAGRFATERGHRRSADDERRRAIVTALLCNFRVDLGPGGEGAFAAELARLEPLEGKGLVRRSGSRIEVTPLGRLFVRNVAMAFDAYLASRRTATRPTYSRTV